MSTNNNTKVEYYIEYIQNSCKFHTGELDTKDSILDTISKLEKQNVSNIEIKKRTVTIETVDIRKIYETI